MVPSPDDFTLVVGTIIGLLAIIATAWGGVKAIKEALSPLTNMTALVRETADKVTTLTETVDELTKTVNHHAQLLDKDNKRLEYDREHLDDLEKSNRLMLRGISQLIEHEIHGDNEAKVQEIKEAIDDYLINR